MGKWLDLFDALTRPEPHDRYDIRDTSENPEDLSHLSVATGLRRSLTQGEGGPCVNGVPISVEGWAEKRYRK